MRNHIDEIKLDKFVQRILVFEATEEDNEEENLIDLLASKIGPASGINKVDALIKAIKGRNRVVLDVIRKLSCQELGLPSIELTDE